MYLIITLRSFHQDVMLRSVMVVIVWWLAFQLPVRSVPITTNVVSSNPLRLGVLDITLCDKVCQWLATGRWFSSGTPVSSTNKIDRHVINLNRVINVKRKTYDVNYLWKLPAECIVPIVIYTGLCINTSQFSDKINAIQYDH